MFRLNSGLLILSGLLLAGALALPAQTLSTRDLTTLPGHFELKDGDNKGVSILALDGAAGSKLLVKFDPVGAGSLTISGHPTGPEITFGKWYWIAGDSEFRFGAQQAIPALNMYIAAAEAGKGGKAFDPADLEPRAASVKHVTLNVPCTACAASASAINSAIPAAPSTGLDYVTLAIWIGIGLLLVFGGYASYRYYSARQVHDVPEPAAPESAATQGVEIAEEPLSEMRQTVANLQSALKELAPRLTRCEQKASEALDRQQVNTALEELGVAGELRSIRAELADQQAERKQQRKDLVTLVSKQNPLMLALKAEISQLHTELEIIRSEADQKLHSALGVLAESYAGPPPASPDEKALLIQRLDEELTRFFRQSVPTRDGLSLRRQRSAELSEAALWFVEALHPSLQGEGEGKLKAGIREASRIEKEIEGLLAETDQQRIQLSFSANLSTSTASRESVRDAISTALQAQVQKLNDPLGHFDRRLDSVGLSFAQSAADFLDLKGDSQRLNADAQRLFAELAAKAGLEVIDPPVGSEYQPTEQTAVQMIPSPSASASHTVMRGVSRGFRRAGVVVRKASVILYE